MGTRALSTRSPSSFYPKLQFITGLSSLSLVGKCLQTTADCTSRESSFWGKWKEAWKKRASKAFLRQSSNKFHSLDSFMLTLPSSTQSVRRAWMSVTLLMEGPLDLAAPSPVFPEVRPPRPAVSAGLCPCSCCMVNTGSVLAVVTGAVAANVFFLKEPSLVASKGPLWAAGGAWAFLSSRSWGPVHAVDTSPAEETPSRLWRVWQGQGHLAADRR